MELYGVGEKKNAWSLTVSGEKTRISLTWLGRRKDAWDFTLRDNRSMGYCVVGEKKRMESHVVGKMKDV